MASTDDGRAALRIIDRFCLAGEIAYQPGAPQGMTEFRCGCQQVGKSIHALIEEPVDWDAVEREEQEYQRKIREQEMEIYV
jgi:hypothetical protein